MVAEALMSGPVVSVAGSFLDCGSADGAAPGFNSVVDGSALIVK